MTKHTPGPWYVKYCSSHDEGSACRISPDPDCEDSYEGVVYDSNYDECSHMMTEEDARLIAAAPDLLESLKACIANHCPNAALFCSTCTAAREVIKKAEGGA